MHGIRVWVDRVAFLALTGALAACGTVANQSTLVVGNLYEDFITVGGGERKFLCRRASGGW